jgi:predicted phage terminase large subunit-like protein
MSSLPRSLPRQALVKNLGLEAQRILDERKRKKELAASLKADFASFVRAAWSTVEPVMPLIDNWHIDALAIHCQAVAERQIRFLMINIGPGYAKSLIASVLFSGWLWAREPQTRIIAATYASSLTVRDSARTRDLLTSDWYRATFSPEWEFVKTNEDYISNSVSGSRRALSVGGKATGFRADGQIFDDLLNATDKHSKLARDAARDWAISTMSSRFNDMRIGWRVVIGQRLHESDPYGAMLATGNYEHLCLPSEYEPERRCKTVVIDPLTDRPWEDIRTEPGQLLFPTLFTKEVLAQAKKDLGSYDYAGQHQQRPSPAEGGILKRAWWRRYKPEELPALDLIILSVDASFKDKETSDYVAIHAYGISGSKIYLIARRHDRMGFTETKAAVKAVYGEFGNQVPNAVLIEDKANGTAVVEELGREIMGVVAITPEGGKIARAHAAAPTVEAGDVYLPEGPMGDEVIEETAAFPTGSFDDDTDALTQALNWWRQNHDLSVWARLGGG